MKTLRSGHEVTNRIGLVGNRMELVGNRIVA